MNTVPLRKSSFGFPVTAQPPRICQVTIGHQYGQQIIKPACRVSEIFCEIAGTKTLTRKLVEQMKSLGYQINVVNTLPESL